MRKPKIKKDFHTAASKWLAENELKQSEIKELGYAKTEISKKYPSLF